MNCQHQQGLDCDVVRALFAAGLDVLTADTTVDGHFIFLAFMLRALPGAAPRWSQLAASLTRIAEQGSALQSLLQARGSPLSAVRACPPRPRPQCQVLRSPTPKL